MTDTVADWLGLVHDRYPPATAAGWDRVGLQVGDPSWPVARVLVSLDVTGAVVDEAADGPPTLVLAHHPLLFRPLDALTPRTAAGKVALAAARAGVAVAAAHTNLDVAADGTGTSDPVMRVLGIDVHEPLTSEARESYEVKLVTFVPSDHVDPVLDALVGAGAGVIGDYERCSFRAPGTGTFRPRPGTHPYSGDVGADNAEVEDRLEIVVPRSRLGPAIGALRRAHPYEEVAFDVYPLVGHADLGFGRVGDLAEPMALRDLAERVHTFLPAPHLRYAGAPDAPVRRVAAVGGSGDALVPAAMSAGADVLVTGDLKHHPTLEALELGLAVVDAGHHATEVAALPAWMERLSSDASHRGLAAELLASSVDTSPWI